MDTETADITRYLAELDALYRAGNATEHSYRPALKTLLEAATSGLTITNEPKRIECGAPDYIVTKGAIPLGYIEAKDIGADLNGKANREQFERYKQSLGNLIITDYLKFQLFAEGEEVARVTLAQASGGGITADKKQFPAFLELIDRFTKYSGKTIYNSEQLAKMMALKARLLSALITQALPTSETELLTKKGDDLVDQLMSFRVFLIHDLSQKEFADIFAQTIAYGMFAAKLNDRSGAKFTRMQAALSIPQSNPFLKNFFRYIAAFELDVRICWIVDALADLFNSVAIEDLLKEFAKANQDPYIHFYETFLGEFDPAQRKGRGVWYTPAPIVKFIVQAVDDILISEFDVQAGLADKSKVTLQVKDDDGKVKETEFHKVQILDPATGTGTFLAAVIDKVYEKFANQKGMWALYCKEHLIPRLNGFEILMASYAMAHFKLDMKLKETGISSELGTRLNIYLTNSLEEAHDAVVNLDFGRWLSDEAKEAARIKKDAPVMVILANPPYNISTQTKNEWIDSLISDYKKEPNSELPLQEQKLNLNDDYVKFIRYGQYLIQKNSDGILAYINNHSFLDNPTFRGMRYNLLQTFDKIYIIDLHGNVKKTETMPDGSKDENVFDIQQGVSINIFIKNNKKNENENAEVFHYDLYGRRNAKYLFLLENTLANIKWNRINCVAPFYFFVPKNTKGKKSYEKGFYIPDIFPVHGPGIKTERDKLTIHFSLNSVKNTIDEFLRLDERDAREKFKLGTDSRDWKIAWAKKDLLDNKLSGKFLPVQYRPFDFRWTFYTGRSKGFIGTPSYKTMRHLLCDGNIGFVCARQFGGKKHFICFVTKTLIEISSQPFAPYAVFPLYLYPENDSLDVDKKRRPNLNIKIVEQISTKIGLHYSTEKEDAPNTFAPTDLLDYIYAVLHSPNYRKTYSEFLKIDFPRVPYPESSEQFCKLAALGGVLRGLHLMENVAPIMGIADFPISGSNEVEALGYKNEQVYINKTQHFGNVPPEVWEYYIGGYQSAQKWLKDRKGRKLSFEDIEHYQKIIAVLKTTIDLQAQVDEGFSCFEEM